MPRKVAAVIVLKELGEISGNSNREDECDSDPEWTIKIRINSLKRHQVH